MRTRDAMDLIKDTMAELTEVVRETCDWARKRARCALKAKEIALYIRVESTVHTCTDLIFTYSPGANARQA
jgi:hypothetical protein